MAKKISAMVIVIIAILLLFSKGNGQSIQANMTLPHLTGSESTGVIRPGQALVRNNFGLLSRNGRNNEPEVSGLSNSTGPAPVPTDNGFSSVPDTSIVTAAVPDDVPAATAAIPTAVPISPDPAKQPAAEASEKTAPKGSAVPIAYYHSVKTVPGNELSMPPEQLEEQMKYLRDNNFQSVSLSELYDFFYGDGILPSKPIVITFDDGYKDNYTNALPILRKYGFTATVFVTVGQNGSDFLTRDEMKELLEAGWEIESHTMTHPELSKLNPEELYRELQQSKRLLEQDLGREVKFLAYPYGTFNEAVIKAAREAGYLMAFTTKAGWAADNLDPMLVKRVYLYTDMGIKEFARRVEDPTYYQKKGTNTNS